MMIKMADFNKAFDFIKTQEGGSSPLLLRNENEDQVLLCSKCFKDEGLRLDAEKIGFEYNSNCINCGHESGVKLNRSNLLDLSYRFFVRGTLWRPEYGGAPLIEFNEHQYGKSKIDVSEWLVNDVKLLETTLKIGFFYYGPRLWMLGEVEPLRCLQSCNEREKIIERIIKEYPSKKLQPTEVFYRIRINPKQPVENGEYDTPPEEFLGNGRLESKSLPILYASQDLEVCIHECRATIEDDIFVASMTPTQELNLLDLTEILDEDNTEFESLDMAMHMLFLAGKHSYEISKEISLAAFKNGFDGIIYPSFFSLVRTGAMPFETILGMSIRRLKELKRHAKSQTIQNIALFGRPLKEGTVNIKCINKIILNKVIYDISFGPAYHEAFIDEAEVS